MKRVVALDLGTTRIKGGCLDSGGDLVHVIARDAPPLTGTGHRRESSAESYLEAATAVLDQLLEAVDGDAVLGLASQRSSFTIWNAQSGSAMIPLVSWQDRRAADWCARHADDEPMVRRITGLPLSPHYAGPKLRALCTERPDLSEGLARGTLRFGTLESWVIARWTSLDAHETDGTMAARTLLANARERRWDPTLLGLFGARSASLPTIRPTFGRDTIIGPRMTLAESVGDQPAATLAALGDRSDDVLINLGTGGFVLRPTGSAMVDLTGYLGGPLVTAPDTQRFAIEGTINGAGHAVDRFAKAPTDLPSSDPTPEAFALPDDAGVGAPHWRVDRSLTLSAAAERLDGVDQRRVVAEGIVFRVREIFDALGQPHPPSRVCLSGGLARDPFFAPAMAACLDRPIEVLTQGEQTLRGAAWLANGCPVDSRPRSSRIAPHPDHRWLRDKYPRWRQWLDGVLKD